MADDRDDSGPGLRGRWYFVVTLLSLGLLAWVPVAHAAVHLRSPLLVVRSVVYAALDLLATVLLTVPIHAPDPRGNAIVGIALAINLAYFGTLDQIRLRRKVYRGRQRRVRDVRSALDPAIRAILANRELRAAARAIVAKDPLMAHELRIGRPDLPNRGYDDGGLVDLNAAPATAIAATCALPISVAEAIVAARPFAVVDDVVTLVEIPLSAWGTLRDRGVAIWF